MAGKVTTKDRDRGFRRIVAQLKEASGSEVTAGWHADKKHDGLQTAEIASVHEYGSPARGIPARPVIGPTVDQNRAAYQKLAREAFGKVLDGKDQVEGALTKLGAKIESDLKRRITDGEFEPLKPATIARKGSSKPLIDTGTMRQQIGNRVGVGKKAG